MRNRLACRVSLISSRYAPTLRSWLCARSSWPIVRCSCRARITSLDDEQPGRRKADARAVRFSLELRHAYTPHYTSHRRFHVVKHFAFRSAIIFHISFTIVFISFEDERIKIIRSLNWMLAFGDERRETNEKRSLITFRERRLDSPRQSFCLGVSPIRGR